MVVLANIVELNMGEVFKRIENLSDGKTIDFHGVNKSDLNEINKRYQNNPNYSIRAARDIYSKFFVNELNLTSYQVRVDRIKETDQNA